SRGISPPEVRASGATMARTLRAAASLSSTARSAVPDDGFEEEGQDLLDGGPGHQPVELAGQALVAVVDEDAEHDLEEAVEVALPPGQAGGQAPAGPSQPRPDGVGHLDVPGRREAVAGVGAG